MSANSSFDLARSVGHPFRYLAAIAICLILMACSTKSAAGRYAGVELIPAKAKPDFVLTATDGKPFDFRRDTDGHLTLLFFGYTYCPDVCPVHLANIAASLQRLPAGDRNAIRVVFVTTDPRRDSLPRLRQWLDNFDSTFVGLRGDPAEVNKIESSLGLAPAVIEGSGEDYTVGHAAQILAFTPDDSLRVEYPFGVRQKDWVTDLPKLLIVGHGQ